MLATFSKLRELISRKRYKTKVLHFQCQAFLQSVASTLSIQRLWTSNWTGFIEKMTQLIHNSFF